MTMTPSAPRILLCLFLLFGSFGVVSAQSAPTPNPAATSAVASLAGTTADDAVATWLKRTPLGIAQLSTMEPEEVCAALPGLIIDPPPEPGTKVNIDDRQEQPSADPAQRVFTYSAVRPGDRLDVLEVELRGSDEAGWTVDHVGYRNTFEPQGVRLWLQQPAASWLFVGFTLLVIFGLARPSRLRVWLRESWQNIRQHRRLVIGTMVVLYAMFGLGALVGTGLPKECEEAILTVVTSAVTSVGATDAYGSGNIMRAAVTTFYQNFVVVTLSVTFTLSLLFGIPAYLLSIVSYFVQGIPFGLLGDATPLQFLLVLILLLLELTSYFLVVAGGGMLLATLFRKGFSGLPQGFRKLMLTLPVAMVLLLIAAWYEALIVIQLGG